MKMDEFPVLGHQMTHSIDSYITDSANSASALYTGHKSTVNAMGFVIRSKLLEYKLTWPQCIR
jgi:alkaline phosphatase